MSVHHWRELFACLSWHLHHNDRSPLGTLNRLARKATKTDDLIVTRSTHKLREVYLYCDELVRYRGEDYHKRAVPKRKRSPFILLRQGGRIYLLDGQTRLNYYLAKGRDVAYRCYLLEEIPCES